MADPNSVAQSGQITLEIAGIGLRIDKFKCYRFAEHFLNPSDSWTSIKCVVSSKVLPCAVSSRRRCQIRWRA